MSEQRDKVIKGRVFSGLGKGAYFTQLDWVKKQCLEKLGFVPFAGTLNLEVSGRYLDLVQEINAAAKVDIVPPSSDFCPAKVIPISIGDIKAAIIVPYAREFTSEVHAANVIEVIAPVEIKKVLNVKDGDEIIVTLEQGETRSIVKASMVKGIIFDFDETLVNSLETFYQVFSCGMEGFNLPAPDREKLASLLKGGQSLREIVSQIYPGLDKETIENCTRKIQKAAGDKMKEFPITPKPKVKKVLSLLKMKGIRLGLVTGRSCSSEEIWSELGRMGLAQFFDAVVTGEDLPRKPAPDGIIACLKKLNLAAKDSVFVGDSKADLIAAKRAEVRVIILGNEGVIGETFAPEQPDVVIDNLTQLVRFLEPDIAPK